MTTRSLDDIKSQYTTLLIVQDLILSRSGKCVCDIAASIRLNEKSLYKNLAFLLATRWAQIDPISSEGEFVNLLAETQSMTAKVGDLDLSQRYGLWRRFFDAVGDSAELPIYFVSLTKTGEKEFKGLRQKFFEEVA